MGTATKAYLRLKDVDVVNYDLMFGQDIRDYDQLYKAVEGVDRVLHLAAIARMDECDQKAKLAHSVNVDGTRVVCNVCKALHKPLVYASTGTVYAPILRDPPVTEDFPARGNNVYGVTKFLGEEYVREVTPHIILRYAHLYGKEKRYYGLIGKCWDRIQRGLQPQIYGGTQSNDFVYLKDVAQANWRALSTHFNNYDQTYNIGTGVELTTLKVAEVMAERLGWKDGFEYKEKRSFDQARFVYDISKARQRLGYEPQFTLDEGLKDMFRE